MLLRHQYQTTAQPSRQKTVNPSNPKVPSLKTLYRIQKTVNSAQKSYNYQVLDNYRNLLLLQVIRAYDNQGKLLGCLEYVHISHTTEQVTAAVVIWVRIRVFGGCLCCFITTHCALSLNFGFQGA